MLQNALRAALDDQGLRLLYRFGGDWVDVDGTPQARVLADDLRTAVVTESGTANVMLYTARSLVARYRDRAGGGKSRRAGAGKHQPAGGDPESDPRGGGVRAPAVFGR
jgi:hypothetical protein